jgi:hypothetical protein
MTVDDAFGYANMRLDAIDVHTPPLPFGPFEFPEYLARFEGPGFFGDDNICHWPFSGFCSSQGAFGFFHGELNGSNLTLQGGPVEDVVIIGNARYDYSIYATAASVPEPSSGVLLASGLALVGYHGLRKRAARKAR